MSEQNYNETPAAAVPPAADPNAGYYNTTQPGYTNSAYGAAPAAGSGLSDNAAGALAYVTIIPAILFLVMAPYNQKPFVKFHAFQCLGLAVTGFVLGFINIIPILGQIVFLIGLLCLFVLWILCIVKASQGGAFKLPLIGKFAAEQSGYGI
jgi:uncharacterized membrane protein